MLSSFQVFEWIGDGLLDLIIFHYLNKSSNYDVVTNLSSHTFPSSKLCRKSCG